MRNIYCPFPEDKFMTIYWFLRKQIDGVILQVDGKKDIWLARGHFSGGGARITAPAGEPLRCRFELGAIFIESEKYSVRITNDDV